MNHSRGLLLLLVVGMLVIINACTEKENSSQALTASLSDNRGVESSLDLINICDFYFKDAQQAYNEKKYAISADKLRHCIAYIKVEFAESNLDIGNDLRASLGELENLAGQIENNKALSQEEINTVIENTKLRLVGNYTVVRKRIHNSSSERSY